MQLSLLDRRVPQFVGVYLAASWGCVEFSDFAVGQFSLSPAITSVVVTALLLLLPGVILLAWRHGAPGHDAWTKVDGAVIGANLLVAAGVLFVVFGGQELGAATTVKLVEDMDGNTVERVVPKAEFRRSVLVYNFDNETDDPDMDWLGSGLAVGVLIDLVQDLFVTAIHVNEIQERLAESGFDRNDRIPLSLKREATEQRNLDYFLAGNFSMEGEALVVETRLHATHSARQLATHTYRGADALALADAISLDLRRDLGIPEWQIEEAVDLPAAELVTSVPEAFRPWVEGQMLFTGNDLVAARVKSEEAIALDSTFAYAYANAAIAALLSGDPLAGNELLAGANRYLYRLPERQRLAIQVIEKWFFQQDPAGALRASKYWTEVYPQDAEARRMAGTLAALTNDQDEMIAQLRALLAIDPADTRSARELASAFQMRREYDSALVHYQRLSDRRPSDVQARLDLAAVHRTLGQYSLARTELEQATLAAPTDPDPLNQLARIDMREGLYEAAADRTEQVGQLARTPQERAGAAGLEESLYHHRGQFGRLMEAYRTRLAALAEFAPPFVIVQSIENSEALERAAEAGREAWALDQIDSLASTVGEPFNRELQKAAVQIHLDLGDIEAARGSLDVLRRGAESFGTSAGNESFLTWIEGRIAEIEDGNCTRALERYDQAAADSPEGALYRVSRLRCLTAQERWRDAEAEASWLLERLPGYPSYRVALARYHAARGQTREAIEHLEAATDIWSDADPDYIPAQEAQALLEELQGS